LIGTHDSRFTTAADLSDAIAETDERLRLHFLRGDNAREREVVISLANCVAREAA
jgi:predicted AAA+ superfamily ATPase